MLITEFRITLPVSLSEYQVAQRFVVAELSKQETGGGEGVEVVTQEIFFGVPLFNGLYDQGQYTKKKYYVAKKLPTSIQKLVCGQNLEIEEESWNAFPYGLTTLANPNFMRGNFSIKIESMHVDNDKGLLDNVLNLTSKELQLRDVVHIDIVNDDVRFYQPMEDPSKCKSFKAGRGPLLFDWQSNADPVMTCYKVVTSEFKWWGLQSVIEEKIVSGSRQFITDFSRKLFCWMDKWYGLTLEDIVKLEIETKEELDRLRLNEDAHGTWTYPKTNTHRVQCQPNVANLRAKLNVVYKLNESPKVPAFDRGLILEPQKPNKADFKAKSNKVSQTEQPSRKQGLRGINLDARIPILWVKSYIDAKDMSPKKKIVITGFNFNLVITYPE